MTRPDDDTKGAYKRLGVESATARVDDGAPPKHGLLPLWRAWSKQRRQERLQAKARSHETLKNYKPPTGHEGGAPGGG